MDAIAVFVDAVKTSMGGRVAAGHVVTVVRELLARCESRRFTNDFISFDHELAAVGVSHHPFASEEGHRSIRTILDRDEINKRVGLIFGQ